MTFSGKLKSNEHPLTTHATSPVRVVWTMSTE